jgi:ATP-binding cassette subfamily B protein
MSLNESLPDDLRRHLDNLLTEDESVQLSLATDVTPAGNYGEEWLVATARRGFVFSKDGEGYQSRLEFPIEGLTEPAVEPMLGGGMLEALSGGRRLEILNYSNSLAPKFGYAAKALKQLAAEGSVSVDMQEDGERRCKSCRRPIPAHYGICPVCVDRSKTLRRIFKYVQPLWKRVLLAGIISLVSTAAALVPADLTRVLFDNVIIPSSKHELAIREGIRLLLFIVGGLAAVRVVNSILDFWRGWLMAWLGGSVTRAVRQDLYECLQRLQLRFFDRRQTGRLISRTTRDTEGLQWFLIDGLQMISIAVLLIIGVLALMAWRDWRLALVTLTPLPLVAIISMAVIHKYRRLYHRVWHRWSDLSALVADVISGIRVVKAFAQEKRETSRFHERNTNLFESVVKAERMFSIYHPAIHFAMGLGLLLVWFYGGWLVLKGELTPGVLTEFTVLLGMIFWPIEMLARFPDWYQRAMTAAERIFEVLDSEPEPYVSPRAKLMPKIDGRVEFRNVTFGYDKHNPILHDVNLVVEAGQMLGLVGHSGAGKSTVINLICRFYDPDEGEILIDDVPLKDISLHDLRSQIGVVPQEPFLFCGTIAENIAYGNEKAAIEEIIAAARAANAHEFIMRFPDGYDTIAGERGMRLSAGERQRIAIARAILRNPRILILDEATASVDTETEHQIQEALDRLVQNRTTFAIAHRLSTLRNADMLMVLEEGRLAEMGTHDELLARKDGVYTKLVRLQGKVSRVRAI